MALRAEGRRPRCQAGRTEGGYGWVVVAASFLTHAIMGGVLYSMGIFYIMFKENLAAGTDSSVISLVPSIFSSCSFALAPLSGVLTDRYDGRVVCFLGSAIASLGFLIASLSTTVWHLCLVFGVVAGCGQSIAFNPAMSLLAHYFDGRLGLASGVAVSGVGVGSIVYPHLLQYLERQYGWRGALQLNAALYLHMFVCAALFRRPDVPMKSLYRPVEVGLPTEQANAATSRDIENCYFSNAAESERTVVIIKPEDNNVDMIVEEERKEDLKSAIPWERKTIESKGTMSKCGAVFRSSMFCWFGFSQMFFMMGSTILFTHLGAYCLSLGFAHSDAALVYLTIGLSSGLSRLAAGIVSQIPGCYPVRMYTGAVALLGVTTAVFPLLQTMPLILGYAGLFGVLSSPFNTFSLLIVSRMMSIDLLPTAIGFLLLFLVPGSLFGAPAAGVLYDGTKMYASSFFLAAALIGLSGVIILPLFRCCRQVDTKAERNLYF